MLCQHQSCNSSSTREISRSSGLGGTSPVEPLEKIFTLASFGTKIPDTGPGILFCCSVWLIFHCFHFVTFSTSLLVTTSWTTWRIPFVLKNLSAPELPPNVEITSNFLFANLFMCYACDQVVITWQDGENTKLPSKEAHTTVKINNELQGGKEAQEKHRWRQNKPSPKTTRLFHG